MWGHVLLRISSLWMAFGEAEDESLKDVEKAMSSKTQKPSKAVRFE
jgi:hypothetical protein